ncbi:MAG: hypothetical protein ABII07_00420 [Patescibacteria group bacterium]|nr:hypothetical protein [Patescibacteria group bacterium]
MAGPERLRNEDPSEDSQFNGSDSMRLLKALRQRRANIAQSVGRVAHTDWKSTCVFAGGELSSELAYDPVMNDLIELEGE